MEQNQELAAVLEKMAFLAELKDENPFKVRALSNAAGIIGELPKPLEEVVASGEIKKIPGIGKGTQAIVAEFLGSGKVTEFEELQKGLPEGVLELREVRGLGPKKIKSLYTELGVGSLAELEYACLENRLLDLKGFGEKTQASVLKNIKALQGYKGKVILPVALQEAEALIAEWSDLPGVSRAELTGDLRRHSEVVPQLDLLLAGKEKEITSALLKQGFQEKAGALEKLSEHGLKVRAHLATPANFGSRWVETTGPGEFVAKLGELGAFSSEEEAFASAKKKILPPECRDLGQAPAGLIEEGDIKGVFHLHTTWSDGKNTLEEMADAAVKLGLEYLGVSDHSQTAFYAHGLDEKRVMEQKKEIEKVQKKHPNLRIFHGIESDILSDGSLDYPASFLKNFDFVIASVHGQMRMSRQDMTRRICRALENPATTWLGHWTGRILLGREAYDFDLDEVLKCAADNGKAIELNANPYRLDIDWRLLPEAVKLGIGIGIFPDAHSAGGLADTKYGVWMARKAGLKAADVLNTKTRSEMEKWLQEKR